MARIRTIKPGFFKNEELAELPMVARLLFIGLWTLADVEGRLEDRPKRIKAELFPYDNVEVDQQLSRLQSAGFIYRYEVGDLKVIQVQQFTKHQRITGSEATSLSELPPPSQEPKISQNQPFSNSENLIDNQQVSEETLWKHSGNTLDDRKGKEGKGKEGINTTAPAMPSGGGEEIKPESLKTEQNSQQPQGTPRRELQHPFSQSFENHWDRWLKYKKEQHRDKYKSEESERLAIKRLIELSGGDEARAIAHIDHAIGQTWKGFYPIKDNNHGTTNNRQPTASGVGAAKGNSAGAALLASMLREQLGAASGA